MKPYYEKDSSVWYTEPHEQVSMRMRAQSRWFYPARQEALCLWSQSQKHGAHAGTPCCDRSGSEARVGHQTPPAPGRHEAHVARWICAREGAPRKRSVAHGARNRGRTRDGLQARSPVDRASHRSRQGQQRSIKSLRIPESLSAQCCASLAGCCVSGVSCRRIRPIQERYT